VTVHHRVSSKRVKESKKRRGEVKEEERGSERRQG
jgi:hypothetical protein